MNWNTIYITGNANFWEDVNNKLLGTDVRYMVGSLEQHDGQHRGLYWLADSETIDHFKRAIGAKLIWRYRLRFENEVDTEIAASRKKSRERFTERERSLIQKMRLKTRKRITS